MASIVTSKFRIHNAQQFYESFSEAANTIMYLFVGKNTAFANDNSPPTPINSTANIEYTPWRDMYGVKRIQSADVTHAVPRYDWTSGTVYTAYDDTSTSLLTDTFYVMTEDYNVYKCLFNNASAASTTKPTGTSSARFTTADGYIWKYMYTVTTAKALKFLTNDYIPVQTLTSDGGEDQWDVQTAAVDGGIHVIKVTAGGSGYATAPAVTITGDGTGATANSTITANVVTKVTITAAGTGYTRASVTFASGAAAATAIISPKGGHGSDAVEELGGKFIMLNVRLDGTESNTFSTSNEFRQVGIVRDPYLYGTAFNEGWNLIAQEKFNNIKDLDKLLDCCLPSGIAISSAFHYNSKIQLINFDNNKEGNFEFLKKRKNNFLNFKDISIKDVKKFVKKKLS